MRRIRRIQCQSFTRAYPIPNIPNGTASTTWFSCPNAAESNLRANPPSTGADIPLAGAAEGMPDSRRASHARPCTHVHRDSTETSGGFRDRISEREERDRHRSPVRQGAQLYRRALLGPRLRRIDRRVRTGAGPPDTGARCEVERTARERYPEASCR